MPQVLEKETNESLTERDSLLALYGSGKGLWDAVGGGDAFIRSEREGWDSEAGVPPPVRCHADPEGVWQRVRQHAGEVFHTSRGLPLTYAIDGNGVWFFRDGKRIERRLSFSQFAAGISRCPVSTTTEIRDLFDPSYLFALLKDDRIRGTDW